jgi:hypothetical protein
MSLKDDIQGYIAQFLQKVPKDIQKIMQDEAEILAQSGITEKSLKVGDRAPAFSLPDIHGNLVSSETLLVRGPLVVSFYRGGW